MTPPREKVDRNSRPDQSFELAMSELEGRVVNGESKLKELRESVDSLKQVVMDDRLANAQVLGEIKGGLRVLIALGSVALAVVTIGLTVIGLVLKR